MSKAFNYYGDTLTSSTNSDLFDQIKTATSEEQILAKHITMVSSSPFTFKFNGKSWVNTVYQDADALYKVSMSDVIISSIIVVENGVNIFIAILF